MTTTNFISNLFTAEGFYMLIGILVVILLSLYAIFAFIVVRQVNLMNVSFKTSWAFLFTFLSYAHFFASVLLLILSILLLL